MKTITDNIKPILATFVNVLSFTYFFVCLFSHVKPDQQIIIAIVGSMATVNQYYFGGSTGASKKDETISELAKK